MRNKSNILAMKKIVLLFLLAASFVMPVAAHAGSTNIDLPGRQMSRIIAKSLAFPEAMKASVAGKTIAVSFTVSEDGRLLIGYVDTENPELKEYLRRELEDVTFEKTLYEPGKIYLINLKFSVL